MSGVVSKTLGLGMAALGSQAGLLAFDVLFTGVPTVKDMKERGPVKGLAQNLPSIAFASLNNKMSVAFGYGFSQAGVSMFWENAKSQGDAMQDMKYTGSGYTGTGYYNMSDAGYTMRQRAMQKMQGTAGNINQVFGNEARNYVGASRARGSVI